MKTKLTKRVVEALKPGKKDIICWDNELRGFGVKITPKSRRVYFIYYRTAERRERRPSIGIHGVISCENAREIAGKWLRQVADGKDPADERKKQRAAETFAQFAERYMSDYAKGTKKASTLVTDRINLVQHLLPAFGRISTTAISRYDVIRLHQGMKATPGAANRSLALLSHMMNIAEKWGIRADGTNPCRHVEKYKERKRDRYLTSTELKRLGAVFSEAEKSGAESQSVIAAIRLLIFTGCRRGEILSLHWDQVDFDNRCLQLPDSKTGAKTVHLNAPALEILSNLERLNDNPFVITGKKPGTHLVNLRKPWQRILETAGLNDVRLHDLRHSYASVAVGLGEGLPIVGALLGHAQARTTQRYAHLANDPVKAANERIGATLLGMLNEETADIVEFNHKSPSGRRT